MDGFGFRERLGRSGRPGRGVGLASTSRLGLAPSIAGLGLGLPASGLGLDSGLGLAIDSGVGVALGSGLELGKGLAEGSGLELGGGVGVGSWEPAGPPPSSSPSPIGPSASGVGEEDGSACRESGARDGRKVCVATEGER